MFSNVPRFRFGLFGRNAMCADFAAWNRVWADLCVFALECCVCFGANRVCEWRYIDPRKANAQVISFNLCTCEYMCGLCTRDVCSICVAHVSCVLTRRKCQFDHLIALFVGAMSTRVKGRDGPKGTNTCCHPRLMCRTLSVRVTRDGSE